MYTLLVVDDEEDIRRGIIESNDWSRWGFTVIGEADCGETATELILKYHPDVVLSDIRMPGMDGVELMQWVKEHCPDTLMVILSGYSDFSYMETAIKNNVASYILKPTDLVEFEKVFLDLAKRLEDRQKERIEKEKDRQFTIGRVSVVRASLLSRLLAGQILERAAFRKEMEKADLPVDAGEGRVAVAEIHYTFSYIENVSETQRRKNKEWITEFLNEEINRDKDIEGFFFLNLQAISCGIIRGSIDYLRDFFARKKKDIYDKKHLLVHIGTSLPTHMWEDLPKAYEQARHALDESYEESPFSKKEEAASGIANNVVLHSERLVTMAFMSRDEAKIREMGRDFSSACSRYSFSDFAEMDSLFMNYIHLLLSAAEKSGIDLSGKMNVNVDDLYSIESFTGKKVFVEYLTEKILGVVAQRRFPGSRERLIARVVELVEEEYCSPQLSLNQIAEKVRKSPAYVSTAFKDIMGKSFLNYVRDLRMQKAISLLKSSQMRIYEIAQESGYADTTTFFRTFKAYTGVSPVDFQKARERDAK